MQWLFCLRAALLGAVVPGLGCHGLGEPLLELVEGQGRLFWRKWIFKRVVKEEESGLARRKGKVVSGLGISPLLPKPSLLCLTVYPPELLAKTMSSLELTQALT